MLAEAVRLGREVADDVVPGAEDVLGVERAAERLFPPDTLMSAGLEGTPDRSQLATRPIIGGTGQYMAATGQVTQQYIADNTSIFADGSGDPSPCFRFEFDLRIPD